jgi:hypothetical protein
MNPNIYFSDDEVNNNVDSELDYQTDDSFDDDTRRLVYNALENKLEDDLLTINITKTNKEIKQKNKKLKTSMTLDELIKKIDIVENKPKKFVSKRAKEKKSTDINQIVTKRHFNPRMVPYNSINKLNTTKNNNINFNNNNDFPTLK